MAVVVLPTAYHYFIHISCEIVFFIVGYHTTATKIAEICLTDGILVENQQVEMNEIECIQGCIQGCIKHRPRMHTNAPFDA